VPGECCWIVSPRCTARIGADKSYATLGPRAPDGARVRGPYIPLHWPSPPQPPLPQP
jgi:hypothetical protein